MYASRDNNFLGMSTLPRLYEFQSEALPRTISGSL